MTNSTRSETPSTVHPEYSGLWTRWKGTAIEWLAVIIACASAGIALISMFVTSICIGIIWSQNDHIQELDNSLDVYRIRATKLNAYLAAHGIPIEEIYDE